MKTQLYYFLFFGTLLIIGLSCQKENIDIHTIEALNQQATETYTAISKTILSKHFDEEVFDSILIKDDPETYKVFLGRVLFYDKQLSVDKSVACASCHQQQNAFSDNVAFSEGVSGNVTDRNSIGLASFANFATHYEDFMQLARDSALNPLIPFTINSLFWDERASTLEDQMKETFANPKEMGMDLPEIATRIEELDYASVLYAKAFVGEPVTTDNVIASIAAFINQVESTDSPFDIGLGEVDTIRVITKQSYPERRYFNNFSSEENNGKRLFLTRCASCHAFSLGEIFRVPYNGVNKTTASNGLDKVYLDKGIGSHTMKASDYGVFKIPGLRNVELTAPYMHDGRFATLEEVVDFYSTGIQSHRNLSPRLKFSDGTPVRMEFTEYEKADLVAFLKTLTSTTLTSNPELSDPFK